MRYLLIVTMMTTIVFAAEYGHMSTEKMMQMCGNVSAEHRMEFKAEMQKRMHKMTPEQKAKYTKNCSKTKHQKGDKQKMMQGEKGMMHQKGKNM